MPIYTYQCPICDKTKDDYNTIIGRHNGPMCCEPMEMVIVPVNLAPVLGGGDWPGYMCPVTDKFVTSRNERRNIMAKYDLVEAGDMKPSKARQAKTEALLR